MLLKVRERVIFRYDAKSSCDPWCIAYDAKSESKPQNKFSARLCARGHQRSSPMGGVNKNSILSTPRPWSVLVCLGVTVSRANASPASSDA
eukprot:5584884-Prymnesium_polylepis.1